MHKFVPKTLQVEIQNFLLYKSLFDYEIVQYEKSYPKIAVENFKELKCKMTNKLQLIKYDNHHFTLHPDCLEHLPPYET